LAIFVVFYQSKYSVGVKQEVAELSNGRGSILTAIHGNKRCSSFLFCSIIQRARRSWLTD